MTLRDKLIRLAHANPEIREAVLPLLQKEAVFGSQSASEISQRVRKADKELMDHNLSGALSLMMQAIHGIAEMAGRTGDSEMDRGLALIRKTTMDVNGRNNEIGMSGDSLKWPLR